MENQKRSKTFYLHCKTVSNYTLIREYLMTKYSVYTAVFENGYGRFRIVY